MMRGSLVARGLRRISASSNPISRQIVCQEGEVGVIKPGAWGDMIAVSGDPLADVGELADVDAVIKGGVLVE